ncbi:hypothetical protein CROQUDRAFT_92256 [Cronartium quercuum f. sp. fusiforme G11]|uniref:Uncharacterized protein n=1 Tax=Cronartium quercuum f. sp. fusiforme G11 TaxID=708437 RepID=A0A9P6NIT2_9BASI|nr:hypothetical protein CROQUDRAFT_92256 [Cronartium quercuum f. sp. fusiforme G11]
MAPGTWSTVYDHSITGLEPALPAIADIPKPIRRRTRSTVQRQSPLKSSTNDSTNSTVEHILVPTDREQESLAEVNINLESLTIEDESDMSDLKGLAKKPKSLPPSPSDAGSDDEDKSIINTIKHRMDYIDKFINNVQKLEQDSSNMVQWKK